MKKCIALIFTSLFVGTLSAVVVAAEPVATVIIANDGIGFSRMEDGKVIAYDPVAAYENSQIIVADCAAHKADYKNVTWCFANAENTQLFQAAAAEGRNKYEPFGGGHCSLGLSVGNLVARGDPRTAIRIGNALVLNGNFNVRAQFLTDSERNMDMGRLRFDMAVKDGSLAANK